MNRLTCMHCGETYPDFDVAHVCSKGPYTPKIKLMSNNRIKELEKQCWSHRVDGALVDGQLHFDTTKFAELIVLECMKVAVYKDSGYIHPADVAGYMAAGRSTAAQMIKEHFGVEE